MPKLTKKAVDGAAPDPASRDRFVWDTEVRGFGLKVSAAGTKTYVLQYRTAAGRSRRYSIGKHGSPWTCDEARGRAVTLLRDLAAGTDPLEEKAAAKAVVTVADLADLYLAEGAAEKPNKKASSWTTDRSGIARHIKPLLGRRPIKQLTSVDVAQFQADVAAGKSAADEKTKLRGRALVRGGKAIAARNLAVLKAMLEFGVRRKLLPANPAKGVKLFKIEGRERFLLDREVIALAEALTVMEGEGVISETMAQAIRLLLLTGCRKQEIATLQWAWVDVDRSCLRLPDSKTGAKVVPLATAALDILASLPRTSPYVLPSSRSGGPIVGLQRVWDAVRKRATVLARERTVRAGEPADQAPNLDKVRIHDLRHSFASFAVADGAPLFAVGKVLGHRQSSTTEIYAHLHDDPLKAVADRTGAKIAAALKAGDVRGRAIG